MAGAGREGSLEAPERHPLDWKSESFWDEDKLFAEMERVFDICHGCRRCFSLCNSFPTMFDAIDESDTMEVDGLDRQAYWDVVDHCYLCDMCFMTKCPYVPPHEFNVDFPHLMLRAKAVKFRKEGARVRDRLLTNTGVVGRLAGIPVVAGMVNGTNRSETGRKLLEKTMGVHRDAVLPEFHADTLRKREKRREKPKLDPVSTETTTGEVLLFATCYGNRNAPAITQDLIRVFEHNGIPVDLTPQERCCGMPKLELGDLETVQKYKDENIPMLAELVDQGYDITAPIPSCVLMFKQELPLMFPDDEDVKKVQDAFFDPFEYLMLRHKEGKLKTEFKERLGKISYHVPCHLRVQNLGLKSRDILRLVPDTEVEPIERCSGHNGTYAVKVEFHETSMKIGRPVFRKVAESGADHYASDCPMATDQIENGLRDKGDDHGRPSHPISLLAKAYGLTV